MRFAYADPPYLGCGASRYGRPEWDQMDTHCDLMVRLFNEYPEGWAMSCNPKDLWWLLSEGTDAVRVCFWGKTMHQIHHQVPVQYACEVVLLSGGRDAPNKPMVRDWISGPRSQEKGLVGAKPDYFNDWVLALLNYQPGDELDDLFPGTGGMGRAVERANHRLPFAAAPTEKEGA